MPVSIAIGTGVNSNDYSTFFTFLPPKGLLLNFMTVIINVVQKRRYLIMEKITSFTIDHLKLVPGLYVSRKDCAGKQVITTFARM